MIKMILKMKEKVSLSLFSDKSGFAQIPLMVGLLIMAVAIPLAAQLAQKNTENRGKATTNCVGSIMCYSQADGYEEVSCDYVGTSCTAVCPHGMTKRSGNCSTSNSPTSTPRPNATLTPKPNATSAPVPTNKPGDSCTGAGGCLYNSGGGCASYGRQGASGSCSGNNVCCGGLIANMPSATPTSSLTCSGGAKDGDTKCAPPASVVRCDKGSWVAYVNCTNGYECPAGSSSCKPKPTVTSGPTSIPVPTLAYTCGGTCTYNSGGNSCASFGLVPASGTCASNYMCCITPGNLGDGSLCSIVDGLTNSCTKCKSTTWYFVGTNVYCGVAKRNGDGSVCSIFPPSIAADSCDLCSSGTSHARGLMRFCGPVPMMPNGAVCSAIAEATDSCNYCASGKSYQVGLTLYCGDYPRFDDGKLCSTFGKGAAVDSCELCKNGWHTRGLNAYCGPIPTMNDGAVCSIISSATDSCTYCKSGTSHTRGLVAYCGPIPTMANGSVCSAISTATDSCNYCASGKSYQVGLTLYCGDYPRFDDGKVCSTFGKGVAVDSCELCKNGWHTRGLVAYCGPVPIMEDGSVCSIVSTATDSCRYCKSGTNHSRGLVVYCGPIPTMANGSVCSAISTATDSCNYCASGKSYQVGLTLYCGDYPRFDDGKVCSTFGKGVAVDSCELCKNGWHTRGLVAYCGPVPMMDDGSLCSVILTATDSCQYCKSGKTHNVGLNVYCGDVGSGTLSPTPIQGSCSGACQYNSGGKTCANLGFTNANGSCSSNYICCGTAILTSPGAASPTRIPTSPAGGCVIGQSCTNSAGVAGKCVAPYSGATAGTCVANTPVPTSATSVRYKCNKTNGQCSQVPATDTDSFSTPDLCAFNCTGATPTPKLNCYCNNSGCQGAGSATGNSCYWKTASTTAGEYYCSGKCGTQPSPTPYCMCYNDKWTGSACGTKTGACTATPTPSSCNPACTGGKVCVTEYVGSSLTTHCVDPTTPPTYSCPSAGVSGTGGSCRVGSTCPVAGTVASSGTCAVGYKCCVSTSSLTPAPTAIIGTPMPTPTTGGNGGGGGGGTTTCDTNFLIRVQSNDQDSWKSAMTISNGSAVNIGCLAQHPDGNTNLTDGSRISAINKSTNVEYSWNVGKVSQWVAPAAGVYQISCTKTSGVCTGKASADKATLTVATGSCQNECPQINTCYQNGNSYNWFAQGYQMAGYTQVDVSKCAQLAKPIFMGKAKGDANCDGSIDIYDRSVWTQEFVKNSGSDIKGTWQSDFNCDGFTNIYDRSIWTQSYRSLNGVN